jgi:hypothetical protein
MFLKLTVARSVLTGQCPYFDEAVLGAASSWFRLRLFLFCIFKKMLLFVVVCLFLVVFLHPKLLEEFPELMHVFCLFAHSDVLSACMALGTSVLYLHVLSMAMATCDR